MPATQTIAEDRTRQLTTLSTAPALAQRLRAARARTQSLISDLDGQRLLGPQLTIVNPPLWEIAHLAWFQEYWCLRYRAQADFAPSLIVQADSLYDSARVPHATRWQLPLLPFDAVLRYMAAVLERVLERLQHEPADPVLRYFTELAAAHEEMHCEAFTYTRQTLGYAPPRVAAVSPGAGDDCRGDASITGGDYMLGAPRSGDFVFDNEKWAHRVALRPYAIAHVAVSNAEFAAFVDAGGYRRREFWTAEGWHWRSQLAAEAPAYWSRDHRQWLQRSYDEVKPLRPDAAVVHVNWYEADAWCRWAGRRLPTEAEWENAAASMPVEQNLKRIYPWGGQPPDSSRSNLYGVTGDVAPVSAFAAGDSAWGCRQMTGNVWEWTADWFNPYPDFEPDPYKEYSEPWFGNHRVLRGGSFATSAALLRNTWRNFYTPDRRDVFAGFRTCSV